MYQDLIRIEFAIRWAKHKCNVPGVKKIVSLHFTSAMFLLGCQRVLVIDGGVKENKPEPLEEIRQKSRTEGQTIKSIRKSN